MFKECLNVENNKFKNSSNIGVENKELKLKTC